MDLPKGVTAALGGHSSYGSGEYCDVIGVLGQFDICGVCNVKGYLGLEVVPYLFMRRGDGGLVGIEGKLRSGHVCKAPRQASITTADLQDILPDEIN